MSGSATRTGTAPARGVQLRTGAEPSFARARGGGDDEDDNSTNSNSGGGLGLNLPPPRKAPAGPSIPAGQRPESEVKLVGKPLMFKPLSVARKPGLNKMKKKPNMAPNGKITATAEQNVAAAAAAAPPPKKKVSLFSMGADTDASPAATTSTSTGAYEPLFNGAGPTTSYDDPATTATADDEYTGSYEHYEQPYQETPQQQPNHQQSLTSIADDLNLSKEARRELFGRGGVNNNTNNNSSFIPAGAKVISFNMEQEYAHNEALRQSGTEQVYNPVRSIVPGKHSLRQMVSMVQNNQAALEESFVAGKNTRKDAAGRYGWK
ncbi:mitotic checkpoint regulator, MAD2B-interacting-domain-containing protein [Bombardia bombarda]|uniref:Mitotic checkpoint regulator, MAD2B-interacting-domain-containing protein n=1 Tax=Bombardia bombarda TaxID=252184 RepID=A0AA39XBD8_9PEZI|nr:mitotic checkpoint regulator, MAD2B-interacting-domain-containing protein [Bombardia bombarda]